MVRWMFLALTDSILLVFSKLADGYFFGCYLFHVRASFIAYGAEENVNCIYLLDILGLVGNF